MIGIKLTSRQGGAGGFIPTNLSGCVLWLRADLGITLNGSDVSAWADQSGQGRDVSQGTAANQPAYNATGGPLSTAAIEFAYTDYLRGTWTQAQPMHMFAVVIPSTNGRALWDGDALNSQRCLVTGVNEIGIASGAEIKASPVTIAAWNKIEALYSGASGSLVAGAATASGNVGANSSNGLTLNVLGNVSTWPNNITLAEVIQYSAEITGADLTALRAYLNARYGL